jgi:RimJ/RimL family protein N-acetyltransferase
VQRWTAVPPRRTEADAARWIAGEAERRRRGLAVDLVVSPADGDDVWGEVGLGPIDWPSGTANLGWWVAAPARGRGVATRAAVLLATWATTALALQVATEVDPANPASARIAARVRAAVHASRR